MTHIMTVILYVTITDSLSIVFLPVLQSCSHWVEMQMEHLVSSHSLSREINMIVAPPQAGMMGTVGVPPLKIMTVTSLMDSVLRQVSL